ncbi:MAG: Lrp/AsnC family transcriptional regulator [Rhodospirillaceae bacterium]|nr:Lrp/AsnC family transcriptional regulator [Rhodospirillaceae bacterium]
MKADASNIDAIDRAIIAATQGGLPLKLRPYDAVGDGIGLSGDEVQARILSMLGSGVIRRIGAIPNHYKLGFSANGMTVWDINDEHISELGQKVGALEFVSHCYHRPRHLPHWPYNMFAMVHGANKEEVNEKVKQIADILGNNVNAGDIIYSKRILKKTGLRIAAQ